MTAIYGNDPTYVDYFDKKEPLAFFGFSSLAAMVDYIERIPFAKRTGRRSEGFDLGNERWAGTATMGDALTLARDGWKRGYDTAQEIVEFLRLAHTVQRRRIFAVAGGSVSVGRMLAGHPAHMVKRPKLPGKRNVTLFAECGNSASVGASTMIVRAAVIGAICDIMESEGYSCEIVSVICNCRSGVRRGSAGSQTATTIKHAGEKLNLNDLVFALGHPSYLRRLNFALVCSSDECEPIWSSQGYPDDALTETKPNEFFFPLVNDNLTADGFNKRVLQMVKWVAPKGLPIEIRKEV